YRVRFCGRVTGGLGRWGGRVRSDLIARRMRGDETIKDPAAEMFYQFAASRPINDLEALACCILGPQPRLTPDQLAAVSVPVAIMAGGPGPIPHGAPPPAGESARGRVGAHTRRNHTKAGPAPPAQQARPGR